MGQKNHTFLTVISILTLLVVVIGTTFSYLTAVATRDENLTQFKVDVVHLVVSYTGGPTVSFENLTTDFSEAKQFTVSNDSERDIAYSILWQDVSNHVEKNHLLYSLTSDAVSNTKGSQLPNEDGSALVSKVIVPAGATHTYTLDFSYAGVTGSNESFVGTLKVIAVE